MCTQRSVAASRSKSMICRRQNLSARVPPCADRAPLGRHSGVLLLLREKWLLRCRLTWAFAYEPAPHGGRGFEKLLMMCSTTGAPCHVFGVARLIKVIWSSGTGWGRDQSAGHEWSLCAVLMSAICFLRPLFWGGGGQGSTRGIRGGQYIHPVQPQAPLSNQVRGGGGEGRRGLG